MEAECGLRLPDIICDLRLVSDLQLEQNGYVVVYDQTGVVRNGSRLLPGRDVEADQFIAIRKDLLPFINEKFVQRLDFG